MGQTEKYNLPYPDEEGYLRETPSYIQDLAEATEQALKDSSGIKELAGTSSEYIDLNDITEQGIYSITNAWYTNAYYVNTPKPPFLLIVSGSNATAICQYIITLDGIAYRYKMTTSGMAAWSNWELQSSGGTGSKEIAYEGDTLEGTEAIMIEDSDFEGIDFENDLLERVVTANSGYEKYSDGTLKCWGRKSLGSVAISNAFGTLFVSAAQVFDNFPIAFIEAPVVTKWVNNSGASCWIINGLPAVSETNAGGINLVGVVSGTASDVVIQYMAVGKWK